MKEYIATVSKRGQVTIPAEVQRLLGLHPGDKMRFLVRDDHVEVAPVEFTVDSAYGSVRPLPGADSADLDAQSAEAREERIDRLVRKLRGAE